jgi:hypothetical protein
MVGVNTARAGEGTWCRDSGVKEGRTVCLPPKKTSDRPPYLNVATARALHRDNLLVGVLDIHFLVGGQGVGPSGAVPREGMTRRDTPPPAAKLSYHRLQDPTLVMD